MPIASVPIDPPPASRADLRSVDHALSVLGLRQRESLGRGIAFVVVLALSCLVLIYAPLASSSPDWPSVAVRAGHSASRTAFAGRDRASTTR